MSAIAANAGGEDFDREADRRADKLLRIESHRLPSTPARHAQARVPPLYTGVSYGDLIWRGPGRARPRGIAP